MSIYSLDVSLLDVTALDGAPESIPTPTDEIWFNYYGMQNANIIVEAVEYSAPSRMTNVRARPRANGAYAETDRWEQNIITIRGTMQATAASTPEDLKYELESMMDDMREALSVDGGLLYITWEGVARVFEDARAISMDGMFKRDYYHTHWIPFEVKFASLQPFGRSLERTILDAPYALTVDTTYAILNDGSAPTDVQIAFAITTAGTLSAFTWTNSTTGETMTITHAFADGDLVEIDGEAKTVTLNGAEIVYTGLIPIAIAGNNNFQFAATGAGYSIGFTEQHYSRYY